MRLNNTKNNSFKVLAFGVASTPRVVGLSGNRWILLGIHRRLDGRLSNLSGKPTFLSVLLNDGWVAANDPQQTLADITSATVQSKLSTMSTNLPN